MSVVQRVIVLNKPFKIRGMTIAQWVVLALSAAVAILVGSKLPGDIKIANAPIGIWAGIVIFGVAYGWATVITRKPMAWWRNKVLFALGIVPMLYLPKREEGQVYPDPTIKEASKREDQPYISADNFYNR